MTLLRLFLVRHGETQHNIEKRIQGPFLDDPLNARGLEQAAALERRFAAAHAREGLRLAAVYSSPLKRAWMTAEHVARGADAPPPVRVAGLIEFSWGKYLGTREEGETLAAMKHYHARWSAGDVGLAVEGRTGTWDGESPAGAFERAWRDIGPILDQHRGDTLALVGHGRLFKILLGKLVAGDIARMDDHGQGNTAVSLIEHDATGPLDAGWRPVFINDTTHAAHLMRAPSTDALV
ncbi:MAG: histidine phosphatase family protein [Candidatus Thermoplasmatota archaeon]